MQILLPQFKIDFALHQSPDNLLLRHAFLILPPRKKPSTPATRNSPKSFLQLNVKTKITTPLQRKKKENVWRTGRPHVYVNLQENGNTHIGKITTDDQTILWQFMSFTYFTSCSIYQFCTDSYVSNPERLKNNLLPKWNSFLVWGVLLILCSVVLEGKKTSNIFIFPLLSKIGRHRARDAVPRFKQTSKISKHGRR